MLQNRHAADWLFTLDSDQQQAVRSRRAFVERIANENSILAAAHYPYPGWGRIETVGSKRYWQALGSCRRPNKMAGRRAD